MSRLDVGLDWPSHFRRPFRLHEARRVANALNSEDFGRAYALAAWVAETELSDGRGGSELFNAAEALCEALFAAAHIEQAA